MCEINKCWPGLLEIKNFPMNIVEINNVVITPKLIRKSKFVSHASLHLQQSTLALFAGHNALSYYVVTIFSVLSHTGTVDFQLTTLLCAKASNYMNYNRHELWCTSSCEMRAWFPVISEAHHISNIREFLV